MRTTNFLTTLGMISVMLVGACDNKSNDLQPSGNPTVIPVQDQSQSAVSLGAANTIAVLAGSTITSTGATNVTNPRFFGCRRLLGLRLPGAAYLSFVHLRPVAT